MVATPTISCLLLKVASRCNLACDYCYMYFHADQGWREQPKFMSSETRDRVSRRLAEYLAETEQSHFAVVFHGGEPLLAGVETLAGFAEQLRSAAEPDAQLDVSLQTNGLLLTDKALDALEAADIGVSLSIDGPREAHDRHRRTAVGRGSFDQVAGALERLKRRPSIFAGLLAVVDVATPPATLLGYLASHDAPRVDILLPDANHLRPPPGRDHDADVYIRWLTQAFDCWFDEFPELALRSFDAILDGLAGLPSKTDALGFGDISLITIETDGTYHDLDVLKVAHEGATDLHLDLQTSSLAEAVASEKIAAHRHLLTRAGLAEVCQSCDALEICAGGSVPHRYSEHGFDAPTVYCREMLALIEHARARVDETLRREQAAETRAGPSRVASINVESFEAAHPEGDVDRLRQAWIREARPLLDQALQVAAREGAADAVRELGALDTQVLDELSVQPSVVAWGEVMRQSAAGRAVTSLSGERLAADPKYVERLLAEQSKLVDTEIRIHRDDPWLRSPFEDERLAFEDARAAASGSELMHRSLELVGQWKPALLEEMRLLSREVLFIRDLGADSDKCVSFSDDSVPGALYCSIARSDGLVSPYDLADSLIHEHRHQKLYLLGRAVRILEFDRPYVSSPWREDPRPPSGLLHAVFVFVELLEFWRWVSKEKSEAVGGRARIEVATTTERLTRAFETLRQVALTEPGFRLVEHLRQRASL